MISIQNDENRGLEPPSKERVRRRAWAISAVVCRAFMETFDNPAEAVALQSRVLKWIETVELHDEFESHELEAIEADIGTLDRQTAIDGTWRSEGLVILAWALNAMEMPQHDQAVDPLEVSNSIFFLVDDMAQGMQSLQLRSSDEIEDFSQIQLALHWRLRDFSLHPRHLNFREFAQTAWFGPLNIDGVALAEEDLAIDGVAIAKAPVHKVSRCESIAMERHQAINWLRGWNEIYSHVDTST